MVENRHRHTVWMDDAVWDQVESHYQKDNCSTKNEYIEKAIQFYSGYLDAERADEYLPRVLSDILDGKLGTLAQMFLYHSRSGWCGTYDYCIFNEEYVAGCHKEIRIQTDRRCEI